MEAVYFSANLQKALRSNSYKQFEIKMFWVAISPSYGTLIRGKITAQATLHSSHFVIPWS